MRQRYVVAIILGIIFLSLFFSLLSEVLSFLLTPKIIGDPPLFEFIFYCRFVMGNLSGLFGSVQDAFSIMLDPFFFFGVTGKNYF